ncbi:hypothetical protein [Chamaesiphon sp. GL140_3_metabinner_50]|uniref:DUF7674 family protein n=1 Tax=Chamaesiphon sp. GL140_3_metabinner_50 TaxID=2970812 RepID=UPI0025D7D9AA|nr:hypothetical protein [Chamaesiphon sp. GL140_3_metabinner_50]
MDYIQIDRNNCMEIILREFPAFETQWALHLESWNPQVDSRAERLCQRPIALDIAEFADFAIDTICLGVDPEIERLAAVTQLMLLQGDAVISYAFRTMFLEQIAHRSNRFGFSVELFVTKLQPLGYYHWLEIDSRYGINPSGMSTYRQTS